MSDATRDELALLVADVYELAGTLRRHGEEFAGRVGQTQARWQLLSVLSDGDDWTVPRAANRLGVSRQAVQRVADDLAAEGLLRYQPNPHHRRSSLLELTPDGRATLAAITSTARDWQDEISSRLDRAALRSTRTVMRSILDHIAESDEASRPTRTA